jgi:plastocyanin
MDRRSFLAAVASGTAAGLAGCAGVFGSDPPEYDVGMRASAFLPETIEITTGDTVVWYNNNDRPHTVTAYEDAIPDAADYFASGGFGSENAARTGYETDFSGAVDPGETYERTFDIPGSYGYFCVPHEIGGMVGTVEVRAAES